MGLGDEDVRDWEVMDRRREAVGDDLLALREGRPWLLARDGVVVVESDGDRRVRGASCAPVEFLAGTREIFRACRPVTAPVR